MATAPQASFDQNKVDAVLDAVANHPALEMLETGERPTSLIPVSHLTLQSECVSLTVQNNQVCINLPLGLGSKCIPIPVSFANGTEVQVCLDICTIWKVPTGVKVSASVNGKVIAQQSFGHC